MDKGIVYIHIGLEKTGTTSLQEFFYTNRDPLLRYHNLYYAQAPGVRNHMKLPIYAYSKNIKDLLLQRQISSARELDEFRKSFEDDLYQELKPQVDNGNNILLSNEHLSSRYNDENDIRKLISLFDKLEVQIKVILYLRRHDLFLTSSYSTAVKGGSTHEFNIEKYKRSRYNYKGILDDWSNVVGIDNIIVRRFDKGNWNGENLYRDFCFHLGIVDFHQLSIIEKEENKSLSAQSLEFLSLFNKHLPLFDDNGRNELRGDIVRILEDHTSDNKLTVSHSDIEIIKAYFAKQNDEILAKYFREEEGDLFNYPEYESENESKFSSLTVEDAVRICSVLWKHQQAKIIRLKKRWKAQELEIQELKKENARRPKSQKKPDQ